MQSMSDRKVPINRTLVGLIALACLVTAGAMFFVSRSESGADTPWGSEMWRAGFTRVGLVMGAFWLALPSRHRDAAWANVSPAMFLGILAGIAAVAVPRLRFLLPILAVLGVVDYVLKPRGKQRPKE
jgi:hypothetical protein